MISQTITREKANSEIETYKTISDKIFNFIDQAKNIGAIEKPIDNFISQRKNAFLFTVTDLEKIIADLKTFNLTHLIVILAASDKEESNYPIGSQTVIITGATETTTNKYDIPDEVTIVQYPSKIAIPDMGSTKRLKSLTVE
ncbi:MAG: hypothetical protein WBP58_15200 [Chitinophagaceae bacterium]